MNRYFYYLVLLNMLVNVFAYVPNILIKQRFEGAVPAILLGIFLGSCLLFIYTSSLNKFVGQGIPEILEVLPKWFRILFLSFFSVMWFGAGVISLLAFNNVTIRFINPDISGLHMITAFTIFIVLILVHLKSESLLYTLEIVLIINIPLIILILYQVSTNQYMSWNSMREVGTHIYQTPTLSTVAAATFVFSGYTNMVIFNRIFKEKIKLKRLWFVPVLGLFNLATTFFIPIGFWGADGVGDLTFPWIATADSLQIAYGPIERVITLFIFLYVMISLISVAIHWHVAIEIIRSLLRISPSDKKRNTILSWSVLGSFFLGTLIMEYTFIETDIVAFGGIWLNVRLPSEICLVLLMYFLARRKAM